MTCTPLALSAHPSDEVLDRLAAAASGTGPLLLPHAVGERSDLPEHLGHRGGHHEDHDAGRLRAGGGGVAVATSGSTGLAKRVILSADALAASGDATHDRLGGPGQWLLALPPHHIAGLQVLLRSMRAGHRPVMLPETASFTPDAFTAGVRALTGPRRYVSLVPTQLGRLLVHPEATAAAADLDAVLVGGAALSPGVLRRARDLGIPVVLTYGMSETAGGCVYDGVPLRGVHLRIDRGRIHLAGSVLADGYLLPGSPDRDASANGESTADEAAFVDHGGLRWFRTSDAGHLSEGRLVVDGRLDDVIITGGLKVWPAEVERVLAAALPADCDIAVVGLPDPEWGQRVAVALECPDSSTCALTDLIDHAREALPPHARPKVTRALRRLPRLPIGKVDRARVASLLMDSEWDDGDSRPQEG